MFSYEHKNAMRTVSFLSLALYLLPGCVKTEEGAAEKMCRVNRGPFQVTVVEDGELRALNQTTITAKERGEIEWLASEGEKVKKGDVLVELKKESYEELLEKYENDLKTAESKLEELEENFDTEKKQLEEAARSYEVSLDIAKLRLKTLMEGPTENEKAKADADLKREKVSARDTEEEYQRLHALWKPGIVSKNDLQRALTQANIAKAKLEKQELTYELLLAGPTELQANRAKLDVELAKLDLQIARERLKSQVAKLEEELKSAKGSVEKTQNRIKRTKRHIESSTLRAPHEGTVMYFKHRWGGKIKIGNRVWTGSGIMELPDTRQMKVKTQVSELVSRYVKVGQKTTITVDMIESKEYSGKIVWIDKWGHDKNEKLDRTSQNKEGLAGINVFDVEVTFDEADPRLKLGFNAKVEIPIKHLEDVVYVSKKAIKLENGEPYVRLLRSDGEIVKKKVKLTEKNEDSVVIREGLKEGDLVMAQS